MFSVALTYNLSVPFLRCDIHKAEMGVRRRGPSRLWHGLGRYSLLLLSCYVVSFIHDILCRSTDLLFFEASMVYVVHSHLNDVALLSEPFLSATHPTGGHGPKVGLVVF